jgi:hypothetical protein
MTLALQFDRILIVDWSAAAQLSPTRPSADAIWLGQIDASGATSTYHRSRASAETAIEAAIDTALVGKTRLLIGFDFPMGYPSGFAARLTGKPTARAVWSWLNAAIQDGPNNQNNHFQVASRINKIFGNGPFWGRPASLDLPDLPAKKTVDYAALGLKERRSVETLVPRAQPVWKLYTTGAAGSQGLMGQPMIYRLSQRPGVAVWPFDAPGDITLAEVYPSLIAPAVTRDTAPIKDEAQVRLLAQSLFSLSKQNRLAPLFDVASDQEQGWILGADQTDRLMGALQ